MVAIARKEAAPCIDCGTTGGHIPKKCFQPSRDHSRCSKCKSAYDRELKRPTMPCTGCGTEAGPIVKGHRRPFRLRGKCLDCLPVGCRRKPIPTPKAERAGDRVIPADEFAARCKAERPKFHGAVAREADRLKVLRNTPPAAAEADLKARAAEAIAMGVRAWKSVWEVRKLGVEGLLEASRRKEGKAARRAIYNIKSHANRDTRRKAVAS